MKRGHPQVKPQEKEVDMFGNLNIEPYVARLLREADMWRSGGMIEIAKSCEKEAEFYLKRKDTAHADTGDKR